MPFLLLITALSGFAALVYEILWIRELGLVVGTTTAAISTVIAAFMAGLALGSAFIGRWSDRRPRLLRLYAALEIGIALSALAVMAALPALPSFYARTAAMVGAGASLAGTRFVLVFALLLVPTSLMGGTFPILVKAATREGNLLGGIASRLYAANTAGAVLGASMTGLFLIGAIGIPGAAAVAVTANLAAAIGAYALERKVGAASEGPRAENTGSRTTLFVLWAIGVSGCFALGYEIVWSRALAVVLGHSIYAFTLVLATYLGGIAAGGFLAAPLLDRTRDPVRLFALGLVVLAVVSGLSLYLMSLLPFREYEIGAAPLPYIATNLACAVVVLVLPTLLLGALLPTAIKACAGALEHAGRDVGRVYAWNTLGSIMGSLVTGFVLIPRVGTQVSLGLLVAGNLALALVVGIRSKWRPAWSAVTAVLVVAALIFIVTGRGSPIVRDKALARVAHDVDEALTLEYFAEDDVAAIGMVRQSSGLQRLFADGVLLTHWGIETTFMAHLPLALVPEARDVLILCLGMGNTYLSSAVYPVRVEAVELSPRVVEVFRLRHPEEGGPSANRKITVADARNTVLVAPEQFDVITVDPPPPLYSAGTANFHTAEFFRLCRSRIRPHGVVLVWIPFGHTTVDEFKMLLKTCRSVFPRAAVWVPPPQVGISGAYVVGMGPAAVPDWDEARRRMAASPAVATDLRRFSDRPAERLVPGRVLIDDEIDSFCGAAPIMDDAHPYLEFPLFRNAGIEERMSFQPILDWLRANGKLRR